MGEDIKERDEFWGYPTDEEIEEMYQDYLKGGENN